MDSKETGLYHILIIASVVISGIILYSFISALLQQAKYRRVHNREIESEINALESERIRIAADLHDDLGPVLTAAKMNLAGIAGVNAENSILVDKSIEYLETITGKIRVIAAGFLPSALLEKGLAAALQQFINNLSLDNRMDIQLLAGSLPPLQQQANIHLYRILQEIIHNSCKHSGASRLRIQMLCMKDMVVISASDDGTGFNFDEVMREKRGHGLINIQNRVHLLNGNFYIQASRGTRYYIEVPLFNNTVAQNAGQLQTKY